MFSLYSVARDVKGLLPEHPGTVQSYSVSPAFQTELVPFVVRSVGVAWRLLLSSFTRGDTLLLLLLVGLN